MKLFFSLSLLMSLNFAHAKPYTTQYCEFDLPPGWECSLEGAEYVCQSDSPDRKKEAIIIMAAKIRGEQDSLDEYMAYLKKPKEYALPGGKRQVSESKNTSLNRINGHQWVDSLHLASEVPGFYTRYLATVKEDIGVAVTFSVSKDLYTAYVPMMDKLVSTLKVFRASAKKDLTALRSGNSGDPNFADATFNPNDTLDLQVNRTKKRGSSGSGDDDLMLIIGIAIVAGIAFVIMKKKKGKK